MKTLKRLVAASTLAVMLISTSGANAATYDRTGGNGYQESRRAPCIAPAVALGAIALAAIIAVAIQNSSSSGHSHCHQ